MRRRMLAATVAGLLAATVAVMGASADTTPQPSAPTTSPAVKQQRVRVRVKWYRVRKKVPHYGQFYSRNATWYSTFDKNENPESCDNTGGGGSTSLGTRPRFGEVAVLQGDIPLRTWIWFTQPVHRGDWSSKEMRRTQGGRLFRVEDHIGTGSTLDIWMPCRWRWTFHSNVSFFEITWSHRWVQRYRYVWRLV